MLVKHMECDPEDVYLKEVGERKYEVISELDARSLGCTTCGLGYLRVIYEDADGLTVACEQCHPGLEQEHRIDIRILTDKGRY
jgi:hypothetical protein